MIAKMLSGDPKIRWIPDELVNELYRMRMTDPLVQSACEVRFSQIMLSLLKVTGNQKLPGALWTRVIEESWHPFLRDVEVYLSLFGSCPVRIRKETFYSGDDEFLNKNFERRRTRKSKVDVPYVPAIGSFSFGVSQEIPGVTRTVFRSKDGTDDGSYYELRSERYKGPLWEPLTFHSEAACILHSWQRIQSMEKHTLNAMTLLTCPSVYLEHVITNDIISSSLIARAASDHTEEDLNALGLSSTLEDKAMSGTTVSSDVFQDVNRGAIVDPATNVRVLPKFYKMVSHPPQAQIPKEAQEKRVQFEKEVCLTLKVPHRFINDNTGAKFSTEHSVLSDHMRMALVAEEIRDDLVRALKKTWSIVYGNDEIEVDLPVKGSYSVETIMELQKWGAIEDESAKKLALDILGINEIHMSKGPLNELEKRRKTANESNLDSGGGELDAANKRTYDKKGKLI